MNSLNTRSPSVPQEVIVKERLTRQILRSVMAQFSSLPEALLELADNAFDEFDGIHGGTHLEINIIITKNSVIVENLGGKGMGIKELQSWLSWGEPHKKDSIGEYGQGGKAAMGYIGSSWVIKTKRWDEPFSWELKEDNWDDVSSKEKSYKATRKNDNKNKGIGFCKFEIRKLKKRRQDIKRISEVMSNTYRTYLEDGKASIMINYQPIIPLQLPVYDGFKIHYFNEKTIEGFNLKGWIGRLKRDVRVRGGSKILGGMRLLRKGRLICDGEYFGHPDFRYKASLGTLIGEVDLSKVPVLPNKTGFDTDSAKWLTVKTTMHAILKPHITDLLNQKEEEFVTREEKKTVTQVREMMIEALKRLDRYRDLLGRLAEDRGRKRPEEKEEPPVEIVPRRELHPREKQPRTPPPIDAIGRLQRLGRMPEWEIRVLDADIRSAWEKKEGTNRLIINKKFCLYEERNGDELYIAETAAMQLAKPEDIEKFMLNNYLEEVNLLVRAFCEIYNPSN